MPPKKKARADDPIVVDPSDDAEILEEAPALFHGLGFHITSSVDANKELKDQITEAGGKVFASVTQKTNYLVLTPDDLAAPLKAQIKKAHERTDVKLVNSGFITDSIKEGKLLDPNDFTVTADAQTTSATADASSSAPPDVKGKGRKRKAEAQPEPEEEEESQPKLVKHIKKGKAVVDAEVPNAANYHVYEGNGIVYDVMLNQTEISKNNNKFYVIQVLKSDSANEYVTFTRWGRVGYTGQQALDKCGANVQAAIASFEKKFRDKTRNDWGDRDNFEKVAGKYHLIQRDFGDEDEEDEDAATGSGAAAAPSLPPPPTTLEKPVYDLMSLIFDTEMFNKQMAEIGYDAKKMPLGKLTKGMIRQGYDVLQELSEEINKKKPNANTLQQLSSTFYTVIPHEFGFSVPPVIRTPQDLKKKLEMVEALGDIQIATTILKSHAGEITANPMDLNYSSLETTIKAVDISSDTFKLVVNYVKNTHGATHSGYALDVADVFEVTKPMEKERFKDLHNKQLLWHGSRLTNWAGILSQSLRIAPPEAPSTGYMFGKGCYFADCVSKSANYCFTSPQNNTGLLLLCEVGLGDELELFDADYHADRKLGKAKHSTKGVGRVHPDPSAAVVLPDGVKVPCGKAIENKSHPDERMALQYNEFIVYDVAQVKMRKAISNGRKELNINL
ncbi:hypothetical protein SmJEL517_g05553 [Synchytrium microbalum]|uniref:Poly [ADP-ribose] polymerase n=1 Tax=Synchytrium microbalum TaxID=1806994 RepID=A0A507BYW2_9FUNG|nr:uncharacterized protein SmJEL517_g05553 [Synchytrium microbalum]TPX31004.1 hypothetical protein SmJEL517_g05553 [Synchytrium microbalum]